MHGFATALILDDEAHRRDEMRAGLLEHGVAGDEAATVEEAIGMMSAGSYDLVVCDMVLCDPPGASNPALRGYLAVCFALTRSATRCVVQASSLRRWRHPGAVLTNWKVTEVADVVYGSEGIPGSESWNGGCPWSALESVTAAPRDERVAAVRQLRRLPVVRELTSLAGLGPVVGCLEDAAEGDGEWEPAVAAAWRAFFPGANTWSPGQ
jgi:hypothetical protein